jgi:hypothetical protein
MAKLIVSGANIVWTGTVGRGGHIMYALQWLHGLRLLGHEVLYYDRIDDRPESAALFGRIVDRWWDRSFAVAMRATGEAAYGPSIPEIEAFAREAAGIISLGCRFSAEPDPWLASVHPRVLIDQDPGFSQLWAKEASIEEILGLHDLYFTVGPNIGTSRSAVPTLGLDWRPIWNPVVMEWWNSEAAPQRNRFTTIAGLWLNSYLPFQGVLWGPKAEELRRFLWHVVSADVVASTPDAYRAYVHDAAGEFSCAKGLYVGSRCGWFSDRSACFLAAGRPVVVQDTGIRELLPTGAGLFAVTSAEEAAESIRRIRLDYGDHSARARQIALEHFDVRRVLPPLLRAMGVA